MGISLTKKELATVVGYTYRRLYDIDRNLPTNQKLFVPGDGDKFDLQSFVQRWVDYKVSEAKKGGELSLEEAKAVHEQVKIEKTQLEVARMRGELVEVSQIKHIWGDVVKNVVQAFLRLPVRVADMVCGLDNRETVSGIMEREIKQILEQIADTPLPEEAAGAGTDGEEPEQAD